MFSTDTTMQLCDGIPYSSLIEKTFTQTRYIEFELFIECHIFTLCLCVVVYVPSPQVHVLVHDNDSYSSKFDELNDV